MFQDGLFRIFTAGRRKPARRPQQWGDTNLVEPYGQNQYHGYQVRQFIHSLSAIFRSSETMRFSISSEPKCLSESQMNAMSSCLPSGTLSVTTVLCLRYDSRICRLTLLRSTACLNRFLGTLMRICTDAPFPKCSCKAYTVLIGKVASDWLSPFSKSVSISLLLTMRSCFLKVGAAVVIMLSLLSQSDSAAGHQSLKDISPMVPRCRGEVLLPWLLWLLWDQM